MSLLRRAGCGPSRRLAVQHAVLPRGEIPSLCACASGTCVEVQTVSAAVGRGDGDDCAAKEGARKPDKASDCFLIPPGNLPKQ